MLIDPYQFRDTRIEKVIREARNAVSIKVTLPLDYTFELGQHAVLRIPMPDGTKLVRQYSFSTPPETQELWFTIVKEPNGQVSGWLVDAAKAGDSIELSKPFTGPLMHINPRGEICMIAGGSGIAPLIGYVRKYRAEGTGFTLLYSTRKDELCYESELTPFPGETIRIRLTDQESRLKEADIAQYLTSNSTVLMCGSRPFVTTMQEYCKPIVATDALHSEAFSL